MTRNNVIRLLEAREIPFSVHELPAEKLGAPEAAEILGVDPAQVFKTIVILREGKGRPVLAVMPGSLEVDLKELARVIGVKKLALATQRQAEALTGLLTGGISPLALRNRGFEVVVDALIDLYAEVYISGGQRGLIIRLPGSALISLTEAKLANISR
jgi:Cys-tRNA(Pro)/Cys-tRNA(Cys) deacylase